MLLCGLRRVPAHRVGQCLQVTVALQDILCHNDVAAQQDGAPKEAWLEQPGILVFHVSLALPFLLSDMCVSIRLEGVHLYRQSCVDLAPQKGQKPHTSGLTGASNLSISPF